MGLSPLRPTGTGLRGKSIIYYTNSLTNFSFDTFCYETGNPSHPLTLVVIIIIIFF